jgi:diguanylate cyclase (GGDEF)-like protein
MSSETIALKTYKALDRLFPSSFILKIFFIAFLGTHIPLLALFVYDFSLNGGFVAHLDQLGAVLAATLVGTGLTFAGLCAILTPIGIAADSLEMYRRERRMPSLPTGFRDSAGRLLSSVQSLLTEVERLRESGERLAISDPLTGLMNRRGFDRLAQAAHAEARERSLPMALALFDLDHFKKINDEFGHPAGDEALQAFADVLHVCVRSHDPVARIGGEEFAILISGGAAAEIETVCEGVRRRLSTQGDPAFRITTSIGVATLRPDESFRELYARADKALYLAKQNGRDRLMSDRRMAA